MRIETPEDILAGSVHRVVDAESLKTWAEGPLRTVLPHRAMLCGQWIAHSGGYAAIQTWSFGVPPTYLATIECPGGNVRSPILTRLMRSGGPEFFDLDRDEGLDVGAIWRRNFRLSGWHDLLGLAYEEGESELRTFTSAAFYDVGITAEAQRGALQSLVMPHLHRVLNALYGRRRRAPSFPTPTPSLTNAERAVVELLAYGMTNKEIAKRLEKSDETVKRQLAVVMKRLGAKNRTELVRILHSSSQPLP